MAKTRLCLQYDVAPVAMPTGSSGVSNIVHYKGTLDCLNKVYQADGIRGLYKVRRHLFVYVVEIDDSQ